MSNSENTEVARWSLRLGENPSANDTREFQAWLETDPAHREHFQSFNAVMRGIDQVACAPEMVSLRSRALVNARRVRRTHRAWEFISSHAGKAAGIALVAILLGAGGYGLHVGNQTVETVIGERRVLPLTDGSQLSLDADTAVDLKFTANQRRLVLNRGRAKFEVAKDSLRPFAVQAGDTLVVAIGTTFSVERVENQIRVALYEGRVEVLPANGDGTVAKIPLEPGYELVLENGRPMRRVALDAGRALAWESGTLAFADEPLALAVARVNRYSSEPVKVGNPAAARVHVSGVFHAGDTAAFIDGVTRLFPLRAERDARVTVLKMNDLNGAE
jgi:transmembrane sensor